MPRLTPAKPKTEKPGVDPANKKSPSERKWGKKVIALGFTVVPSLLFRAQRRLGLSPVQLVILLHMVDHWWFHDEMPFPSKKTLAERCDLSERQVQRYLAELEERGYIERKACFGENQGQLSNFYDLSGLVDALKKFEPEFTAVEEQRKLVQQQRELVTRKGGLAAAKVKAASGVTGGQQ
jgi:hypothetical protein